MTAPCTDMQCPFTPRQKECVHWLSQGKTDNEISTIMGISRHTVHRFLRDARERADAVNAPSLVAKSIRSGWIN